MQVHIRRGVLLTLALVVTLLLVIAASAHDAPTGWTYPLSCCSGTDCAPARPGEVREERGGFHVVPSGEVVPYDDPRVLNSPDGEYHLCRHLGREDGKVLCIFVPPPVF